MFPTLSLTTAPGTGPSRTGRAGQTGRAASLRPPGRTGSTASTSTRTKGAGEHTSPAPRVARYPQRLCVGSQRRDEGRGLRRAPAGRGVIAGRGRVASHGDVPHLVVHQVADGLGDRPGHADIGSGE